MPEQRYEYSFCVWPTDAVLNSGNAHFGILFQMYGRLSVPYTEPEFNAFRAGLLQAGLELRDVFRKPEVAAECVP